MSEWKNDDEVTTTYASIQLSIEQAYVAGVKTEQKRIIELLKRNPFIWMNDVQLIQIGRDELIRQIEGMKNE